MAAPKLTDKERLDFIQVMARVSPTGVSFDSYRDHEEQTPREYRMMWRHTLNQYGGSLRDAIDRAYRDFYGRD